MSNNILNNYNSILSEIPETVSLVAVSKTKPSIDIMTLYKAGQRVFGENRIEELIGKYEELPKDIKWHMIGHLQSKKVKKIASFVDLIHSVDSFKLLKEINKQAKKNERVIKCLLQFHIAEEETKYGLDSNEAIELIHSDEFKLLENVDIKGVMGMATFTKTQNQVQKEFKNLKKISLKIQDFSPKATEVSMGMSNDYLLAIQEGSTIIRVGSSIFGSRKQ